LKRKQLAILFTSLVLIVGCASTPKNVYSPRMKPEEARQAGEKAMETGDYSQAASAFNQLVLNNPNDSVAHYLLGVSLYNQKDYTSAEASYRKALELKPDFLEAMVAMGNMQRDLKRYADAITWYEKAISANPMYSAPYVNAAFAYSLQGKNDEVIAILERAVEALPESADMHRNLGTTYLAFEQRAKAKISLEKALALNPGDVETKKLLDDLATQ